MKAMTAITRTYYMPTIVALALVMTGFSAVSLNAETIKKVETGKKVESVKTPELSKSTKKKQAVDIESDSMEIVDAKKQAIFIGKVIAKRGKVTLHAEKLVADFVKEKNKKGEDKTVVTFLNASGGVLIITSTQRITGAWARMDVKADKAVVGGGQVVVKQGDSVIKGKKLNVNLKTDHSEMTGGRVKGSFTPK